MEIAILGGTGDLGRGLALRWARDADHDLAIGSRSAEKAEDAAATYRDRIAEHADGSAADGASIEGRTNADAAATADVVVAAVPPSYLADTVAAVGDALRDDAILVSPAVELVADDAGVHHDRPDEGSYTAVASAAAPVETPVVGAFHTLAAGRLAALERSLDLDALVVGDDASARSTVAGLVEDVDGLRALHAGPLANAGAVEALTPLQITVGRYNDVEDAGVQFR